MSPNLVRPKVFMLIRILVFTSKIRKLNTLVPKVFQYHLQNHEIKKFVAETTSTWKRRKEMADGRVKMADGWETMTDGREANHTRRQIDLLKNGVGNPYDVVFLVGPSKEKVKGHQFQLNTHSTVFNQMFKNRQQANPVVITIHGGTKQEFEQFLQFLYTGVYPSSSQAVSLLGYAAEFKVADLEGWCWKTLEPITEQSAIATYELATLYENHDLCAKARTFILRGYPVDNILHPALSGRNGWIKWILPLNVINARKILDSSEVLKLTYSNFYALLTADSLGAKNETQVFNAVIRWGKEMCKRNGTPSTGTALKNVVKDLVRLIRYPVMELSDFCKVVVPRKVLSPDEHVAVLKYLVTDKSERKNCDPLPFNTKKREWFKVEPVPPPSKPSNPICPVLPSQQSVNNSDTNSVHIGTTDQPTAKRIRIDANIPFQMYNKTW